VLSRIVPQRGYYICVFITNTQCEISKMSADMTTAGKGGNLWGSTTSLNPTARIG